MEKSNKPNDINVLDKADHLMTSRHLDSLIRKVEEFIFGRDKKFIDNAKKIVLDKCQNDKSYKLTDEDKKILDMAFRLKIFHIEVRKAEEYKAGKGLTFLFDRGAIIYYYPKCDTHLQTHFIICHEVGHIFLHMELNRADGSYQWVVPNMEIKEEDEADDFAVEVLKKRAWQFGNPENLKGSDFVKNSPYLKEIIVTDDEINQARLSLRNTQYKKILEG